MLFNLRPITLVEEFEEACKKANLNSTEQKIIDHITSLTIIMIEHRLSILSCCDRILKWIIAMLKS